MPDSVSLPTIPFIDLEAQRKRIGQRMDDAIKRVLDHGGFILGREVAELEDKLATFVGARYCVSCASGTDALALVLMANGIGRGDAVFVPAFTFVATAEVVAWLGATPVFVDVLPETFNLDPASLAEAIPHTAKSGLRPRAIIPVDLFGLPADYGAILPLAEKHGLFVLSDAAQSFGASVNGHRVGTFGLATATSFFPAKPLGCYGDGGAIFTDDGSLVQALKSLRVHGQGSDKYDNVRIGLNGRLDTIQAAILLEKFTVFEDEIARRQRIASRYGTLLSDVVTVPCARAEFVSAWAQYTIVSDRRSAIQASCKSAGVPTAVYYPIALSQQTAYRHFPTAPRGVKISESLAARVLSLPMHPYLEEATQDRIVAAVRKVTSSE